MKKIFWILFLFLLPFLADATHQVSGYITVKCLGGTTYQATIVDYTNICYTDADRDTLRLYWGDGTSEVVPRSNGAYDPNGYPGGVDICSCRKTNIYISSPHQFPGPGIYRLWFDDQDRMANIVNVNYPNSVNTDFYLFHTLIINPFGGYGVNAPILLNNPVCVYACTGECYYYNLGAYSPEGDSLVYSLGPCLTYGNLPAPSYYIPSGASINAQTGTLAWCNPSIPGIYNFSIRIASFKRSFDNGVYSATLVDTLEAELEIIVQSSCTTEPPIITGPTDTCVVAGSSLTLNYKATDPDGDEIDMTASGQPFSMSPPANFVTTGPGDPDFGTFTWTTNCPEVQKLPYPVLITATDIGPSGTTPTPLNSYLTTNITVVGPAPTHLFATPVGNTVVLDWGESPCNQATGYNIYRHQGCSNWQHGYCETGVPSYTGYTLIGTTTGLTDTTFTDNNGGKGLVPGIYYSYLVVATYPLPDGSLSYASKDTCVLISRNVPLITNASITTTITTDGKIFVRWVKPLASILDTVKNIGPYSYVLKRAIGMISTRFVTVDSLVTPYYGSSLNYYAFQDTGNTLANSFNYRVDLYCNNGKAFVGSSPTASTIYLNAQRGENEVKLSWMSNVPWYDSLYSIYRRVSTASSFTFIKSVPGTVHNYADTSLTNDTSYCYYIKSTSFYNDTSVIHPLYDSSEIQCATPRDTIPPCSPVLSLSALCNSFRDSLIWTDPDHTCKNTHDLLEYRIYYTPVEGGDMQLIATITNPLDTVYVHDSLGSVAGCYAVTAVDSAMNESKQNPICVDNCPQYQLPNVFTPNGDGNNDLFTPLPHYRYVKNIDINIYNRWGQIMFHTTNPEINWDGKDQSSGEACPDGVYYYICVVNEIRVTGIQTLTLKGFVQIIR